MCQDLLTFGVVPRKSLTYIFPGRAKTSPNLHHFMRGYFDGDGCISLSRRNLRFSVLGTASFIDDYRCILNSLCHIGGGHIRQKGKTFELVYAGNPVVTKIAKFLYKDATIMLVRKATKFMLDNAVNRDELTPASPLKSF